MAHSTRVILSVLALPFLMLSPIGAHGESESASRGDSTIVSSGSIQEQAPGLKSGTTALLFSLLGTVVPAAAAWPSTSGETSAGKSVLFIGALVVGPSLGHFYAGRPGRALVGVGLRTLAVAGIVGGFAAGIWSSDNSNGGLLVIAGLALGGTSLAWDIIRAPHSVRVHNERMQQVRTRVGIIPMHGTCGLGLSVSASF